MHQQKGLSKGKTLIIFNFIYLLFWWGILYYYQISSGLGSSLYSLALGLYALLMSLYLFASIYDYRSYIPSRFPLSIMCFGISFFGIATILWFYYETHLNIELPFPSSADLFYISHFPLAVFGILTLTEGNFLVFMRRVQAAYLFKITLKTILVIFSIYYLTLFTVVFIHGSLFTYSNYLLIYFPLESLTLSILAFITTLQYMKTWQHTSSFWFVFYLLGSIFWFIGDVAFSIQVLNNSFFPGSTSDLLFAAGVCGMLLGLIGTIEGAKKEGFISPTEPVFFTKLNSYSGEGLN